MARLYGRVGTLKQLIKREIKNMNPGDTFTSRELCEKLEEEYGESITPIRMGILLSFIRGDTGVLKSRRIQRNCRLLWAVTDRVELL